MRLTLNQFGIASWAFAEIRDGRVVQQFFHASSAHTLFQIGSVTKMMTAAAAVIAARNGGQPLDAPIGALLDLPKCMRTFTLDELLSNASGLVDVPGEDGPHSGTGAVAMLNQLGDAACLMPPKTSFSYSNAGYALAGSVLGTAAHTSYETAMSNLLFRPLGFTDSTFNQQQTGFADDVRLRPAGYLAASLADVERFVIALARDSLPNHAAQALQTSRIPIPALFDRGMYGYGLMIRSDRGERVLEHAGEMPNFGAFVRLLPDQNRAFILLVRGKPLPLPDVMDAVDRILSGRLATLSHDLTPRAPVRDNDAAHWAANYTNGTRFAIKLQQQGGTLHLIGFGGDFIVYASGEQFVAEPAHLRLSLVDVNGERLLRFGLWTLVAQ